MDKPLVNVFFSPTFIQMYSSWECAQSAAVSTDPSELAWFNKELKKKKKQSLRLTVKRTVLLTEEKPISS